MLLEKKKLCKAFRKKLLKLLERKICKVLERKLVNFWDFGILEHVAEASSAVSEKKNFPEA